MANNDFDAELALPSVIIDVPELEKMVARKRMVHAAMFVGAGLIFFILSGLIFHELTAEPKEVVKVEAVDTSNADAITLTVKLVPENVPGSVVEVDGEVISGNPPYAYLKPSEDYHSIVVRAPGYESISKDVQLGVSEVMTFALTPVSVPTAVADAGTDEDDAFDTDSFDENSDDLIEEISEDSLVAESNSSPKVRGEGIGRNGNSAAARRLNDSGRAKQTSTKSNDRVEKQPTAAVAAASPTMSQAASSRRASAASAAEEKRESEAYGLGPAPSSSTPAKASLIINAPLDMTSRVAVSVDGQMRGYLPVLLKIEPGLHELTFVYEGHRSFQMVKLGPGQIARIIPNL